MTAAVSLRSGSTASAPAVRSSSAVDIPVAREVQRGLADPQRVTACGLWHRALHRAAKRQPSELVSVCGLVAERAPREVLPEAEVLELDLRRTLVIAGQERRVHGLSAGEQ